MIHCRFNISYSKIIITQVLGHIQVIMYVQIKYSMKHVHEPFMFSFLYCFHSFPSAADILLTPLGKEVTTDWFHKEGFKTPIVVDHPEGLGLKVPPCSFTVADVERYVGGCCMKRLLSSNIMNI